jgi:hypothetical protein
MMDRKAIASPANRNNKNSEAGLVTHFHTAFLRRRGVLSLRDTVGY